MNKAFTKEQDEDLDQEQDEQVVAIPKGTKNYITPAGAEKLKGELKHLLYTERPALVRTVSWAASNGDRSENADYTYGKRRLREIDRRIRFLTKRLDMAEIVDPKEQATRANGKILFGATVEVEDEAGKIRKYRIVGIDEVNIGKGDVSWISPLARALLQAKTDDTVILRSPKGEEELTVVSVKYY